MCYQFDFDATNRILRCQVSGEVTDELLKQYYRLAADYSAKTDPLCGVTDFSGVTAFDVSPQTVRELARHAPALADPKRIRVVVAPTDHLFGMARLFQNEGEETRPRLYVVRTIEEAWALMQVSAPRFERLETIR